MCEGDCVSRAAGMELRAGGAPSPPEAAATDVPASGYCSFILLRPLSSFKSNIFIAITFNYHYFEHMADKSEHKWKRADTQLVFISSVQQI